MRDARTLEAAPSDVTWAAARLRLGQANVGTWTLAALLLVLFQPGASAGTLADQALSWAAVVGVLVFLFALSHH